MIIHSKRNSLLVLGFISMVLSRVLFMFVDDPEGPNLFIVTVLAAIIFAPIASLYLYYRKQKVSE